MPQHQVIPPALADPCIDLYRATYSESTDPAISNSFTHTCSFNALELQQWLAEVIELTNSKHIEMKLAIYTQDVVDAYPQLAGKEGRLTVFLYPSDSSSQSPNSTPPEGAFNLSEPLP